jgi:hypothetical protein
MKIITSKFKQIIKEEVQKNIILNENIYMVGQYKSGKTPNIVWEFQGIYNQKDRAIEACKTKNYFYTEIKLNQTLPEENMTLPTIYPKI